MNDRSCGPAFNRFASRAEAAIVTARQSRLVDPRWLSINSDSLSQSTVESWDCFGPCNSFTALMNAENSRSAICVCCLQIELENDSFVFIGSSLLQLCRAPGVWLSSPRCTRFSDLLRWHAQVRSHQRRRHETIRQWYRPYLCIGRRE